MATKTWTGGANDGNWATAGNWTPSAPAGGDDVIIDRTNQDITAGLATGISIASLTVTQGYGGRIGTSSTALTFTGITGTAVLSGTGQFIKLGSSGTIATTVVNSSGMVYLTAGTFTTIIGVTPYEVDAAAVVTTLNNQGGFGTLGYNATAITTLNNSAGTVNCGRSITTINSSAVTRCTLASSITTANALKGSILYFNSTGNITTYNGYAGSFYSAAEATQATAAGATVTTFNLYGDARIMLYGQGVTQTYTTLNAFGRSSEMAPVGE